MAKEKKEYVIYTKKLAYLLRTNGCNLIKTGINENYPQFITYIFEDTPEFRTVFCRLTRKG